MHLFWNAAQTRSWIVGFVAAVATCGATAKLAAADGELLALDGFDETTQLEWEFVRHDATKVSLTSNPGKLTITTEMGSLGGNQAARGLPASKNLCMIDNPVPDGGDFVVTTCIESFKPTLKWQQAGILIYNDDDNYLKNDMEFSGTAVRFKFIREWEQAQLIATDMSAPKSERTWIRIVKRGSLYERLYSTDGKTFRSGGENSWGDGKPARIGLIAQNGPTNVPGIEAKFDSFEVRRLTKAERDDPRYLARKSLEGNWDVISCINNGVALDEFPIASLVFDGGRMSFIEGGETRSLEYHLDHSKKPKGFQMSSSARLTTSASNGIYKMDGDQLTICWVPQKDSEAPAEFKSTEGDSRILLTLKRSMD